MPVLIKRYANRKLYNTASSRYITLRGIAELLERGEEVKVLDNETGEDMTAVFAAAGTPDEVRQRARVYETRADRLWVTPPHHLQSPADSARWQLGILEAFGH